MGVTGVFAAQFFGYSGTATLIFSVIMGLCGFLTYQGLNDKMKEIADILQGALDNAGDTILTDLNLEELIISNDVAGQIQKVEMPGCIIGAIVCAVFLGIAVILGSYRKFCW